MEKKQNVKKFLMPIIITLVIITLISIIIFLLVKLNGDGKLANTNKLNNNSTGQKAINKNSTAKNDMDLGLSFIKIDNTSLDLTDEQKSILEYFDYDYLDATNYEFLQRYPQVFKGTQVFTSGKVEKIISSNDDTYEMLFWVGESELKYDYWQWRSDINYDYSNYNNYVEQNKNNYVVIKGNQSDTRLIPGDFVSVRGRYIDIETYTIDGVSYTIPVINAYRTLLGEYNTWDDAVEPYSAKEIRQIAKIIFGDVTVREPTEDEAAIESSNFLMNPWYICELDNQSNAKIKKYFFSRTYGSGAIIDYRSSEHPFLGNETSIQRRIEFSPDFEHFYIFIFDYDLKFLTVEYYDRDLNKLWSREFEDTVSATYDFTRNNVYLVANNTLYIINTANGEDTYPPKFVGEKLGVRKLNDSLILFATSQYDAIIKTDLQGNIIWRTNVDSQVISVSSPQVVDNNLIVNIITQNDGDKYLIVDLSTGEITLDAKSYNN